MPELGRYARALRGRLWKPTVEDEVRSELAEHLAMLEDELRAQGVPPAEARRRARERFGDPARIGAACIGEAEHRDRERRRAAWWTELRHDVRFGVRQLRTSARFATAAILTLAIGIGGTTAVFSAVDAVLLQPLPYTEPGQLVRVYQNAITAPDARGFVTPVHFVAFRHRLASLDGLAAVLTYDAVGADIGRGESARRIRLAPISAEYFDVLRARPATGRAFERGEETGAPSVVLSHALWESLGGDSHAVGSALTMNGTPYTIVGVMPATFADPFVPGADAWVPLDLRGALDADNADNHYLTLVGRVRPATPLAVADAELGRVAAQLGREYPGARESLARLYPLKEDLTGSASRALQIMLGAVALVLVLVCVNIANLLLVRATERGREFALRTALGAARGRLVRQLLVESLTLAIAGALAGLVVARLAMTAIVRLGEGSIPRLASLTLAPHLLLFAMAIASLCAVAFGLVPALRATRAAPSDTLRAESRGATGGGAQLRLRDGLVISQVALAFVLLVGAGLLVASVRRIREVDLGVRTAGVLTFELHLPNARYDSTARARFYESTAQTLAALPGVRAAGSVSRLPATGAYHQWGVQPLTGPMVGRSDGRVQAQQRVIAGDYLEALGIPLLAGRRFDARDDVNAAPVVLVSRSLERALFPGGALGQRLRTGGREYTVAGVVGDVALDPEGAAAPYVYHAHTQLAGDRNWALTQVVRADGSLDALTGAARRAILARDPQLVPFAPMPLDDAIGRGRAQRTFVLRLLAAFAGVALALSALGLFGVLSYGVRLRQREFGIRIALGARRGAVRAMVLRRGLTLVAIGTAVGLLGAAAVARVMQSLVFRVSPLDPVVLASAAAFMAVVAAIAAFLPAAHATRVDPRTVLQ